MEIYRVMDRHGKVVDESQDPNLGQELITRMYTTMIQLQAMDNVLYEAQRQGRISFYMTNYGCAIASSSDSAPGNGPVCPLGITSIFRMPNP
jgi:TPP-dependent pyruvate/acetoin dehydrogenase alpha subunit